MTKKKDEAPKEAEKAVASAAPIYKLDKEAAKQADQGPRINVTGKYVGFFKRVMPIVSSKKGTHGINFVFEDESGMEAGYLDVYTMRANGENITMGINMVNAIMACMGVEELTLQKATYKAWDFEEKKEVEKEGELFTNIMSEPIGVVLQRDIYTKEDGSDGESMILYGVFEASTGKTASEKIDGTDAVLVDKHLLGLKDNDRRTKSAAPEKEDAEFESSAAEFDDDIPF